MLTGGVISTFLLLVNNSLSEPKNIEIFAENVAHFTHGMMTVMFILFALSINTQRHRSRLLQFLFRTTLLWLFLEVQDICSLIINRFWGNNIFATINLCINTLRIPATFAVLFAVFSPEWIKKLLPVVFIPFAILIAAFTVFQNIHIYRLLVASAALVSIAALFYVLRASCLYNKYRKTNCANSEYNSVQWLLRFVAMLCVALAVWVATKLKSARWDDAISYSLMLAMWIFFYFKVNKHAFVEIPVLLNPCKTLTAHRKCLQKKEAETNRDFAEKLHKKMHVEQLYLNPNLRIRDLAAALATNRTYLSAYLNNILQTSFYDYVNALRVEKACCLLIEERQKSLEEVAEMCGFGSLSTFRRSFQKIKKQTPNEWRIEI
jgi:AraC-like DNA-binding protein